MVEKIVPQNAGDGNDKRPLWLIWWSAVALMRPAFSRESAFMWFAVIVAGFTVRTDMLGVSSFMRALNLRNCCYDALLRNFHSTAVSLDRLTALWAQAVLRLFPNPVRVNGRLLLVADGTKAPKRGKKMPGVKRLHQQSECNNKAEWIMGHSLQGVCLLVNAASSVFAVPLALYIHEGVRFTPRDKRTLMDKLLTLIEKLALDQHPFYLVADAYYANGKTIKGLRRRGNHLISRMRSNSAANLLPIQKEGPKKRGRPQVYGELIKLATLLKNPKHMEKALSPVYGEQNVTLRYRVKDLLWKPAGCLVRFVAVVHPTRGSFVLISTDTSLSAVDIIRIYGLRFKIGVSRLTTRHSVGESPTEARDLRLVAREAPWNESETVKPSDSILRKEYMRHTRLQRTVNVDVASSNYPVAETVDCARRQQESFETSLRRRFSPAGYQRRHGVKDVVETGETRDARRRNLAEEARTITASGKCVRRRPGGGSGRSTDDGRAAKRARREGPGPLSDLSVNVRHG